MSRALLPIVLCACVVVVVLQAARAQSVKRVTRRLEDNGGHYMGASLQWRHRGGNRVDFTLYMTWRRNYSSSYFKGSAPDGLSAVGDTIILNGKSWPTLSLGDGTVQQYLSMSVLSFSSSENWVHGVAAITHTYSTPNNAGAPWLLAFQGCCRVPSLNSVIDSDASFALAAAVDLLLASQSPSVSDTLTPYVVDPVSAASISPVPLLLHPHQQVTLVFSGIGYLGVDLLVNSSAGAVAIRTQPNLQLLEGALNAFQSTLRLTSPSALYVDVDVLTFLQRGRLVPSPPNASSTTTQLSTSSESRASVLTGQVHAITFQTTSTISDPVSFDFTGLPGSCSIAPVRRLSSSEWGITVTWPVCDSHLGTQFICATARSASGGVSAATCLAFAVLPDVPPAFLQPPTNATFVIGRMQTLRLEAVDSNTQHVVSVSVIGLQLLRVDDGLPPVVVRSSTQQQQRFTTTAVQVEWAPAVTMGGAVLQLCFSASTQCGACNCSGARQSVMACVTVTVSKCSLEVRSDSTLSSLSRAIGVTWQSLWQLNTDLPHPDFALQVQPYCFFTCQPQAAAHTSTCRLLQPASRFHIGRLLHLSQARTLADISSTYGCDVATLLLLNNDIRNASVPVPPHTSICVVPDPCRARPLQQPAASFRDQDWFRSSQTLRP